MAFEFTGISDTDFQLLDNFFTNGFDSPELLENSQKISLPHIGISSNEWYFDGIRMAYADWHYQKPVELKWQYDISIELITFIGNLKGSVILGNKNNRGSQIMGNYQHNLFYSQPNEVGEGTLKFEGTRSSMFIIQFTKDAFLRFTRNANEALNHFSESVLNGRPALLSPINLPLDVQMQNMIGNILHCSYNDGLKKMFLLSKSIEFLVLQAEACNVPGKVASDYIKTNYDKECIRHAREYVMSNLDKPPNLTELAKIVGVNEYKLKKGFKEMFGHTVFGYISDARLEIAKNDLLEKRKTVSEAALELGYSSVQHFSNSFKKKFGLSPNKFKSRYIS